MNACGKPIKWREKCAVHQSSITNWRWLIVYFIWIAPLFLEFSQTLCQQFSTFHSTLVVNYPGQASFERNWLLLTAFLFLRAYWIVSAGPSGHLKQSIQKTVFEQRTTSIRWRALKSKKLFYNGPNIVVTGLLFFGTVLFFRRRLNSDQYRLTYWKTLKYKTALDHARRP